jgi:hypothetical protein
VSDIDFSNEGLGIGVEPEAVEEPVSQPETDVEATEDVEAVVGAPDADEPAGGDDEPVEDGPVDEPANEWQVRYDEATKVIGRQGQELGELRKAIEEMQRQSQVEPEPQPALSGWQPTTVDDLLDGAATPEKSIDAYNFAAEYAPDYVADVIAEVQVNDPALAKRMEFDYYQRMLEAQTAPLQQTVTQSQAQQQLVSAVDAFKAEVPEWDAIQDEVAKVIEAEPWLIGDGASVDGVIRGLRAAVRMVGQARTEAAQQVQQQVQQQGVQRRQQAAVETGTPAAAPPVEDTDPHDEIRQSILAVDKRRRATN